jgi:Immunity protein family (Imm11)
MYYEVMPDIYADVGVLDDPVPRPGRFRLGQAITAAVPEPLIFPVDNTDNQPPRGMEGISVPAWSGGVLRCLQGAGVDNLQVFRAVLRNTVGGREWPDYFAVNVLGTVSCMSKSSSATRVAERPSGVAFEKVHKLVIDPARAAGLGLFRLAESPGILLMHQRLWDALQKSAPPQGWGISARPVVQEPV